MKLAVDALSGLFRLPPGVLRRMAGPPMRVDGQELDVQNHLVIRLSSWMDGTPIEERSVTAAREVLERSVMFDPPRPSLARVEDRVMGSPAAGLSARIYTPHGATGAAVVYFHGGGWVIGSLDTCDALCAQLAASSGAVVVSVAYRLAPEHVFPAAAVDALNAFDWVVAAHERLGIDENCIGVGGDSAGGNLAAVVAQLRKRVVRYQLLIYPAVDFTGDYASYALFDRDLFLTDKTMRWFIDHYTPESSMRADVRASPLLGDLSGVAPACVVVAGFDPLRDEARAYAQRLSDVGALDVLLDEPSLSHSCMSMLSFVARARYLLDRSARALRAGLTPSAARSPE